MQPALAMAASQRAALKWSSQNGDKCVASGTWFGETLLQGRARTAAVDQDETFMLTCSGPGGQTSQFVWILP
jgi:hypothetical protein